VISGAAPIRYARRVRPGLVLLAVLAVAPAAVADDNAAAMQGFAARLQEYVALRNRLEADLPPAKAADDPAAIRARERALAERIIAAKAGRDGAFFTDRLPVLFRRLIAEAVRDDGPKAKASVRDDNPGKPAAVVIAPYRPYPDGLPLSNVPPAILKALPDLPTDVEYRFVGRDLILRDVRADLVLVVLRDALP